MKSRIPLDMIIAWLVLIGVVSSFVWFLVHLAPSPEEYQQWKVGTQATVQRLLKGEYVHLEDIPWYGSGEFDQRSFESQIRNGVILPEQVDALLYGRAKLYLRIEKPEALPLEGESAKP